MPKETKCFHKRAASKDGLRPICKDCARASVAKYHAANREKIAATKVKYHVDNREKRAAAAAKWRAANPEKKRACNAAWRARKLAAAVPNESQLAIALRDEVYTIAQWLKGQGDDVHVDHILPLSKGGMHHFTNLQIVSAEDNLSKSARMPTAAELEIIRLLRLTTSLG